MKSILWKLAKYSLLAETLCGFLFVWRGIDV